MSSNTSVTAELPTGSTPMIITFFLPGTVLRSDGLWPWTSADGLKTRRYSAGRSNAAPSSKAMCSVRLSFDSRISLGQRFESMIRFSRGLLHVVELTRRAKRLHYRFEPTHPSVETSCLSRPRASLPQLHRRRL